MQDVLQGIRKQTGVVLHEAYLGVPRGRTADKLFDSVGMYQLPVNILFQQNDEAVLEVQITARPSKAKVAKASEEQPAAAEGPVSTTGVDDEP